VKNGNIIKIFKKTQIKIIENLFIKNIFNQRMTVKKKLLKKNKSKNKSK